MPGKLGWFFTSGGGLGSPLRMRKGRRRPERRGGVISPLLVNLFLHYAFDDWMKRKHPSTPFERYADDAIVHCRSQARAEELRQDIAQRLAECGLELNTQPVWKVFYKLPAGH